MKRVSSRWALCGVRRAAWCGLLLLGMGAAQAIAADARAPQVTRIAPRVECVRFHSAVLGEEKRLNVVLPKGFDRGRQGHPFLVFLHGRGRNPDSLLEDGPSREVFLGAGFVTLFPEGDRGWYIDSPADPKARYASYLEEVLDLAERLYALSTDPGKRALAGWSMGGYGCVRFAEKHPGRFAAVSSILGLLDYPRVPEAFPAGQSYPVRMEYFGSDAAVWKTLNPMTLADQMAGASVLLVTADQASDRTMNERFSQRLHQLGIRHRLAVLKGTHSMDVVREAVPLVIAHTQAAFSGRTVDGPVERRSGVDGARCIPGHTPIYLNWDYNCRVLGPSGMAEFVRDAREAGIDGINIRISNKGALAYRTRAGTCYSERLDAFGPDFDPLATLIRECHKQGIAAHVWVDLFEAAYDPLITAHPDFSPQGRPGKPRLAGVPCYAHPEVRSHMLDLVDEYAAYRPDGVFFCTKSSHVPRNQLGEPHNADSGFNPPVVSRYRELYGVDILKEPFDRQKLGRIRGEFVIDFLVEAKRRLNRAGIPVIVGATVSGRLQPTGPNMLLDWRRILERRATDVLLMANSRGEYHVFYNAKGRKAFAEIRKACDKAGVRFWPYIISSGTYQPIAAKVGFAGLLDYVPRQLDYLTSLGGDAILIHDLDLYVFDRNLGRALWKAAGRRQAGLIRARDPEKVPVPDPVAIFRDRKGTVPSGDFEQEPDGFWFLQSSWTLAPDTPLRYGSFEQHASDSRPWGWSPERGGNPKFQTVYDWKVMHGDPFSGRSFSGRASVAIGAQPGAAGGVRTAAWLADIPVPRDIAGHQRIRVQVHGESLAHIESVGMKVECLDGGNQVLARLDAPAPHEGTFPWRPLELVWSADRRAEKLRVRLYLTVASHETTVGRVWFDDFTVEPIRDLDAASLTFPTSDDRETVFRGRRAARWAARPDGDLVSVPFRVPQGQKAGVLKVAMRADTPTEVTLSWRGRNAEGENQAQKTREANKTTFTVRRTWQIFEMPITSGESQLAFHCRGAGVVWIDDVECHDDADRE